MRKTLMMILTTMTILCGCQAKDVAEIVSTVPTTPAPETTVVTVETQALGETSPTETQAPEGPEAELVARDDDTGGLKPYELNTPLGKLSALMPYDDLLGMLQPTEENTYEGGFFKQIGDFTYVNVYIPDNYEGNLVIKCEGDAEDVTFLGGGHLGEEVTDEMLEKDGWISWGKDMTVPVWKKMFLTDGISTRVRLKVRDNMVMGVMLDIYEENTEWQPWEVITPNGKVSVMTTPEEWEAVYPGFTDTLEAGDDFITEEGVYIGFGGSAVMFSIEDKTVHDEISFYGGFHLGDKVTEESLKADGWVPGLTYWQWDKIYKDAWCPSIYTINVRDGIIDGVSVDVTDLNWLTGYEMNGRRFES